MESLKMLMDRNGPRIKECMRIVEEFIAERSLVIYGGFAIDAALRLKSPALAIYDDLNLEFADYDFYSPNVLKDAADLALRLTGVTSNKVEVSNAQHLRTLKVFYEGTNVADISYCPYAVFRRIPILKYKTIHGNVVSIVAPIAQAIDMHIALELPFNNPPREVLAHRANKDIKRYNLLWDEYIGDERNRLRKAIKTPMKLELSIAIDDVDLAGGMVTGLLAYARVVAKAIKAGYKSELEPEFAIIASAIKATMTIDKKFDYEQSTYRQIEIYRKEVAGITHRRLLDVFYESRRSDTRIVYCADNFLYPCVIDGGIHFACVQGVLKMLLAHYIYHSSHLALICYFDLIGAMEFIDAEPELYIGSQMWPANDANNSSASFEYWHDLTNANILDRVRCQKTRLDQTDTIEIQKILAKRPPGLKMMGNNVKEMKDRFLGWNLNASPYFAVDESEIKNKA